MKKIVALLIFSLSFSAGQAGPKKWIVVKKKVKAEQKNKEKKLPDATRATGKLLTVDYFINLRKPPKDVVPNENVDLFKKVYNILKDKWFYPECIKRRFTLFKKLFDYKKHLTIEDGGQNRTLIIEGIPQRLFNEYPHQEDHMDLDHLFTKEADSLLFVFGVAEELKNGVMISVPCNIRSTNRSWFGFLQYTFNVQTGECYHRSFRRLRKQVDEYISPLLSKVANGLGMV